MKLIIINEAGLSDTEMTTIQLGLEDYLPQLKAWKFGCIDVSVANFPVGDPTTDPLFKDFDIKIYITNRKRKPGIAGYHGIEDGKPVAWVSPGTAYSRFGYYRAPLVYKGKVIRGEYMKMGMFGVVLHEVTEILGNPLLNTFSIPDSQGRQWYKEISDHVHGNDYMKVINSVKCVFPDCALPNFYTIAATTTLSIKGNLTTSFTLTPKGYGYYKGSDGKLVKM